MDPSANSTHPLYGVFSNALRQAFDARSEASWDDDVESYLADLLMQFLHMDRILAIRNLSGQKVISVAEMVIEGDVLANADSFDRERQVHKHIGDYILFWAGIYPEYLRRIKADHGADVLCDYLSQGKHSYYVVSTFDYGRYTDEAPTFRKLSFGFESYARCLKRVRELMPNPED